MTKEDFIEKSKLIYGDKYDYSKVEYINNKTKICIICKEHGEFFIRPDMFLNGHGCKKCGIEEGAKKRAMAQKEFIARVKEFFPKYDYSEVNYVNTHTKVKVICEKHGMFEIMPYHLLNGHGCKKCGQDVTHGKQRKSKEQFIKEARKVHGNKYDYIEAEYENRNKNIAIICPIHGQYFQSPTSHLKGYGCPKCNCSILENKILVLLESEGIEFEQEKKFSWLGLMSLDFYLPKYNVAIECQGIQHFKPVKYFGGNEGFTYRLRNDLKKKELCEKNGIKLLYFSSFNEKNVYVDTKKLINDIKNGKED